MIKATKENNKIRVCLDGDSYDLISEFFAIANHVAEMCADTCIPEYREEFVKKFRSQIDNALRKAMTKTNKGGNEND